MKESEKSQNHLFNQNNSPQTNQLKSTLEKLSFFSNSIKLHFQEFDQKTELLEKSKVLSYLKQLLKNFEDLFKLAQDQYNISPQNIKKKHFDEFKEFFKISKHLNEDFIQKRSIYQTLQKSQSIRNIQVDIDFGEEKKKVLGFSKIRTLLNNASDVVDQTDLFIKEMEEEMKSQKFVDMDDIGYKHFLEIKKEKEKENKEYRFNLIKFFTYGILIVAVIIIILDYVIEDKIEDLLHFNE